VTRRLLLIAFLGASLTLLALSDRSIAADQKLHQRSLAAVDREAQTGPLIAPPAACPEQEDRTAPAELLEQAMLCLVDFARRASGLASVASNSMLQNSADHKSRDMLVCDEFEHYACGRRFSHWFEVAGYLANQCWRIGENIAYGRGRYGTPRSIFLAWMRSPSHRKLILNDFMDVGVGVRFGDFGIYGRAWVWTAHFGGYGCAAPPQ
jgi:uncharacterized protein YkwD